MTVFLRSTILTQEVEGAIIPLQANFNLKYVGTATVSTGGPAATAVGVWGNILQYSEQLRTTSIVGSTVGARVGMLGRAVGALVGAVGSAVGLAVGAGVGAALGFADGSGVGATVGVRLGHPEGAALVGQGVGDGSG